MVHESGVADVATDTVVATVATRQKPRRPAKRAPARKKTVPSRASVTQALDGHTTDAVGLVLVAAAIVVALATWAHVAGRAGEAIDTAVDAVVGAARFLVPVGLAAAGLVLLAKRRDGDDGGEQESDTAELVRLGIGSALLLVGVCGLLQLTERGGAIGWVAAQPLRSIAGSWATGTLLVAVALV